MEAAEELSLGSNHHIIKGKRTKRQRPQSPIPFSITANSSSGDLLDKDHCDNTTNNNTGFSPTTTTSSAEYYFPDSTEEEEDMANCLILLARGKSRESLSNQQAEEDTALNYAKYSSRKFLEAAATTGGAGKAGYYVYECKTCNRTFPSFQALGGHRASHKKPKNIAMAAENEKKQQQQQQQLQFMLSSDEEESQFKKNNNVYNQLSLQNSRGNLNTDNNNNNKSKVHECSICGAEFTSGQALGGHMRRHRAPINGAASTVLSLTPMALEVDEKQPKKQKTIMSLELDLNLPAPDDDHKESTFGLASKQQHHQQQQQKQQQQQSNLVFSAPALVDCHY